jgi:phage head maturation protease
VKATPTAILSAQVTASPYPTEPKYRHGEPVGRITGAENREDGLYIDFDIVDTAQGRDAAVLARTGTIKGLSVGFNPVKSAFNRAKDAIQHTAANLLEVSLTPYPAYALEKKKEQQCPKPWTPRPWSRLTPKRGKQ